MIAYSLIKDFPFVTVNACHSKRQLILSFKNNQTIHLDDVDDFLNIMEPFAIMGYDEVISIATISNLNMSTETMIAIGKHPIWSVYHLKHAIIVNQFNMRLLYSLYLKFGQPVAPTRVFEKLKDAEEWLQSQDHDSNKQVG